jgi:protein required for attachment to host cells
MILPNGATVAVVDGSKLQVFRNVGHEPHVSLTGPAEPDLEAASGGTGGRHHSSSANPDRQRLQEDDFAAAATDYLNKEVLAGRIDQLVVVADPRTLGELRKHYHDQLAARLLGELPKHMTGSTPEALTAAIAAA